MHVLKLSSPKSVRDMDEDPPAGANPHYILQVLTHSTDDMALEEGAPEAAKAPVEELPLDADGRLITKVDHSTMCPTELFLAP